MTTKTKKEYISKSGLKHRGWTEFAINKFLGEPDKTVKNPHYSSSSPMQLFDKKKCLKKEKLKTFIAWKEKKDKLSKKRSDTSLKTAEIKRQETINKINSLNIKIPKKKSGKRFNLEQLFRKSCDHYNSLWSNRGELKYVTPESCTEDFLKRISVNFLRHEFSDYDLSFAYLKHNIGKDLAISLFRDRVFKLIKETYPELSEEVDNQRFSKEGNLDGFS